MPLSLVPSRRPSPGHREGEPVTALTAANVVALRFMAERPRRRDNTAPARPSLGQLLLDLGEVTPGDLLKATIIARREAAPLAEILLARGWASPAGLRRALSRRWHTAHIDLLAEPPDARLIDAVGHQACLAHRIVPWRRIGGITFVASARPEGFEVVAATIGRKLGPVRMVLTDEASIEAAILANRRTRMIREAETCTPARFSCRLRDERRTGEIAMLLMGLAALGLVAAPLGLFAGLTVMALALLVAATMMKIAAVGACLRAALHRRRHAHETATLARTPDELDAPLPMISVMVPMYRESDIAARLVGRLAGLTYPRELTDILLVVEEGDSLTRDALAEATLPRWARVVVVPDGPIRTKPRALNYALNFCRGTIIGVWDAEDWPEAEQLHKIARAFDAAPPEVVCLQGILDFYNPRSNWLARCFTIEYAGWFRVVLNGMARLGLFVPLGGTTLFFRRGPLERIGGWDAWNVTEDADLGMRLMRHGWRTEMVDTVTYEEANCRPRAWVKQRSRWHKGYFMTWATHMRRPLQLWRDIGPRAFISFQLQMAGTVAAFLIAPVLWSYWLIMAGLGHPLEGSLRASAGGYGLGLFLTLVLGAELVNIAIGLLAIRDAERRHLTLWIPTLSLYFPLGCLAAWKAIYEVVVHPFYWDKTMHGIHDAAALPSGLADAAALTPRADAAGWIAASGAGERVGVLGHIG